MMVGSGGLPPFNSPQRGEDGHLTLARDLAAAFSAFPQVEAVAVGGSLASGALYDRSDWFARLQSRCQCPYPEPL